MKNLRRNDSKANPLQIRRQYPYDSNNRNFIGTLVSDISIVNVLEYPISFSPIYNQNCGGLLSPIALVQSALV